MKVITRRPRWDALTPHPVAGCPLGPPPDSRENRRSVADWPPGSAEPPVQRSAPLLAAGEGETSGDSEQGQGAATQAPLSRAQGGETPPTGLGVREPGVRAPRGQMTVVFALTISVLIGAMILGVDLSHMRTEAENAQRVANAAALAGVIFLPDYPQNAFYRASETAREDGFVNGQNGVTVNATQVAGYNYRLQVTVREPVPLVFGHLFGLGPFTISRSAVAEFFDPLQAGSPDYVLGYAPFPTTLVSPAAAEGFYLENKGPYTLKESGDAYSPLFESFKGQTYAGQSQDIPAGSSNPCPSEPNCVFGSGDTQTATTPNADHYNITFNGYDYIVDDPFTNTLMIKLFDPYDETAYNTLAQYWDSHHQKAYAPGDSNNYARLGASSTQLANGNCVLSIGTNSCPTKYIDQPNPTGSAPFGSHPVTLEFNLFGPGFSAYDASMAEITATPGITTPTPITGTICASANCVWQGPFKAGADPTACDHNSCTASPYAYRFFNYAVIHGPGVFRLNVRSVQNNLPPLNDYADGTRGNAYGIAVCNYSGEMIGGATDPFTNTGATPGWNPSSCASPNNPTTCPTPGLAAPGACVHLYGLGRMAIHNWISQGASLIPLGYVPVDYAGKTLRVRLYDVGDVSGGSVQCPGGGINCVEVLTPAGDLSHVDGATNGGYASSLPYSYNAGPDNVATGYKSVPTTSVGSGSNVPPIDVSGAKYNGSWLNISVKIPPRSAYSPMVSAFGGYWKVLYRVGGNADDGTTWEISVAGSPVHLVSQ